MVRFLMARRRVEFSISCLAVEPEVFQALIQFEQPLCIAAVLLSRQPEEIPGLDVIGIDGDRAFELRFCVGGYNPASSAGDGFAEIRPSLGTIAAISYRVTERPNRFIVSANSRQHRRKH